MNKRSARARRLAIVLAALLIAGACGSSAPSPAPSDAAVEGSFALRATLNQAIPPEARFTWLPYLLITADGTVVRQGPVPAIFPGPLLPNLQGAPLSDAGYDLIVERARALGLLEGSGDFVPAGMPLGGQTGSVELRIDGELRTITGDPNRVIQCITTPCDPEPGTPEAFGTFWTDLGDLGSLVGGELGQETAYHPAGFALLIGVERPDDGGLGRQIATWPIDTPLADIGRPVGNTLLPRCGTVTGEDAATLETAFAAANQLTMWVDEGGDPADAVSIAVRPVLPGEDPCQELFGIDA
jgi:hypothetical protein